MFLYHLPSDYKWIENIGTKQDRNGDTLINFGWKDEIDRTDEENHANYQMIADMASFTAPSIKDKTPAKVVLTDVWEKFMGSIYEVWLQITGACVGYGGGQMGTLSGAMEHIMHGDIDVPKILSLLMPYGIGRFLGGMKGEGEGSFGSVQARAMTEYGMYAVDDKSVPMPRWYKQRGGWTYGRKEELWWSHGGRTKKERPDAIELGKKHLFGSANKMTSVDDLCHSLLKGCACTIASNRGFEMTNNQNDGLLLLAPRGVWQHQMGFIGYWEHPTLRKRLLAILNNWGPDAHGRSKCGLCPGAFWCTEDVAEYMIRQNECFSIAHHRGYPGNHVLSYLDYSF